MVRHLTSLLLLVGVPASAQWTPEIDLNEKIWRDWNAVNLADGLVESWLDAAGGQAATQLTETNRPTKDSTGVVFSGGTKNLNFPNQPEPQRSARAIVMLFRAAVATATDTAGPLFAINGTAGSTNHRLPMIAYDRINAEYDVFWSNAASGAVISVPKGNDADWHVLITRRVNGVAYVSLDGGDEVVSTNTNVNLPRSTSATGLIGDTDTSTIAWTLKRVLVLQGETSAAEVDRIAGWAMHEMGVAANLPLDHPYRDTPPPSVPFVNFDANGNSLSDWAQIEDWWDEQGSASELKLNWGQPIAPLIAGFEEVFRDDFDSVSTITDEISGAGPWYSPVHRSTTGAAIAQGPADSPTTYAVADGELVITMQEVSEIWYSGVFTSINYDGRGLVWDPSKRPTYFHFRFRASPGNNRGAWPAVWLKDQMEYFFRTVPRTEIDIYEGYASDNDGHHQSYHNHAALRHWPGRLPSHELVSNYTGLGMSSLFPGTPINLFDDQYHDYGAYIDREWMIFTFDGYETSRTPTRPDLMRPLYILVDLAMLSSEVALAVGPYEMGVAEITVSQGDAYAGWTLDSTEVTLDSELYTMDGGGGGTILPQMMRRRK